MCPDWSFQWNKQLRINAASLNFNYISFAFPKKRKKKVGKVFQVDSQPAMGEKKKKRCEKYVGA